LSHLQIINKANSDPKPILLKIAPDLEKEQIDDVIDLALEINLDGLVATNTTISREGLITNPSKVKAIGNGGLSGLPVKERSTEIVRYITQQTKGTIPIIASGGIFTAKDANEKLNAGASLVQVWTGFIYEGPDIVKKIIDTNVKM
jgi:dihydroorotate dehydrogenase